MSLKFMLAFAVGICGLSASGAKFDFKGMLRVAVCPQGTCQVYPRVDFVAPIDFGNCTDKCSGDSHVELNLDPYVFHGTIHLFKYADKYYLSLYLGEHQTATHSGFSVTLSEKGISEIYNLDGTEVKFFAPQGGGEIILVPQLVMGPKDSF